MSISKKDVKILWGRAGAKCSYTNCLKDLVIDKTDVEDYVILGEMAHICAKSVDGPRYNKDLDDKIIDSYNNLILLCPEHHIIIDQQIKTHSIELLHEIKKNHESRMLNEKISIIKDIYSVIWKKASKMHPVEILGPERGSRQGGYKDVYFKREYDEDLENYLKNIFSNNDDFLKNILVIGKPLAGKTRMVYHWLSKQKKVEVIIPQYKEFNLDFFTIPNSKNKNFKKVLFLDDIQRYCEFNSFSYLLNQFQQRSDVIIIATSRSKIDYKKAKNHLLTKSIDLDSSFYHINLGIIKEDTIHQIEDELNEQFDKSLFDGTIGSLFLPLAEMKRRYENCLIEQKTALHALKILYFNGYLYRKNEFQIEWLKKICNDKLELKLPEYQWMETISELQQLEFVYKKGELVLIEIVYLEKVIDFDYNPDIKEIKTIREIFSEDVYALFQHAKGLYYSSFNFPVQSILLFESISILNFIYENLMSKLDSFEKTLVHQYSASIYMILASTVNTKTNSMNAIFHCNKALEFYDNEQYSINFAQTYLTLGLTYTKLIKIENAKNNMVEALKCLDISLEIFTEDKHPKEASSIYNIKGAIFDIYASLSSRREFLIKSIENYGKALDIRSYDRNSLSYGQTLQNLGVAYNSLGYLEDRINNIDKAIGFLNKALEIRTEERTTIGHIITLSNLANSHVSLAGVKDTINNCKKAIDFSKKALKIKTLYTQPIQLGSVLYNLGSAFLNLGAVQKDIFCYERAIKSYSDCLYIRTSNNLVVDVAKTHNALGICYIGLAKIKDNLNNTLKAKTEYENAIEIWERLNQRFQIANIQNNLSGVYLSLAEIKDPIINYEKSIMILEKALEIRIIEKHPYQFAQSQLNLGISHLRLAKYKQKAINCKKAIDAINKALIIYKKDKMTAKFNLAINN